MKIVKFNEYFSDTIHRMSITIEYSDEDYLNILSILERDCSKFMKELKNTKTELLLRGNRKNIFDKSNVRSKSDFNGIQNMVVRKDRKPVDMNQEITEEFDLNFEVMFNEKLRTSGVFVTKSRGVAFDYGEPYIFFPIDNYRYFWHPGISDLFGDIQNEKWYPNYVNSDNEWEYIYGENGLGSWYFDNDILSDNINDAIEEVRDIYKEYRDKSNNYITSLLKWVPDVSYEKFEYDAMINMRENVKDISDGYKEGNMGLNVDQELIFICDEYYLVDISFYYKIMDYIK